MPTRILRPGILDSERVNQLSPLAELFFRKLMSVVDDYGRFQGHPTLLRTQCYPLRPESVTNEQITSFLEECAEAEVVRLYEVNGKRYIEILNFCQRTRSESRHPAPLSDKCPHLPANDGASRKPQPQTQPDAQSDSQPQPQADARPAPTLPRMPDRKPAAAASGQNNPSPIQEAARVLGFPVSDRFVEDLKKASTRIAPQICDTEIAQAMHDTYRETQKSAGLWLSTVPEQLTRGKPKTHLDLLMDAV